MVADYRKLEKGPINCRMAYTECVTTKGAGSVLNLHLCRRVAEGVLGLVVAAVQFQNREEGSCFCRGWISSMRHSAGRSPGEGVGRRESIKSTTSCMSTFCLPTVMGDLPGLSPLYLHIEIPGVLFTRLENKLGNH